jgi:hypothetical protein
MIKFHQMFEIQLNNVLVNEFQNQSITPEIMRAMRECIRTEIEKVFSKSRHDISSNAKTWLTDQYFKSIKIGNNQVMSDQVVINEYRLDELEQSDIKTLFSLYHNTDLGNSLKEEIQNRKMLS